jgi:succinate dehydrogenase hydrophobic anchor subunit
MTLVDQFSARNWVAIRIGGVIAATFVILLTAVAIIRPDMVSSIMHEVTAMMP